MRQLTLGEAFALADSGRALFLEALPPRYFVDGHIPGAKNAPLDITDSDLAALLASERKSVHTTLVVYCSGPTCPNSKKLAERLTALGAPNVAVFEGGKEAWTAAGRPLD